MSDLVEFLKDVGDIRRVNMFTALEEREPEPQCQHPEVEWLRGATNSNVKIGTCRHCGEQVERDVS